MHRFYALQQQQTAATASLSSAGASTIPGQAFAPVTSHPYSAVVFRSRAYILTLLHRLCSKARAQVSDLLLEVMLRSYLVDNQHMTYKFYLLLQYIM